MKNHCPSFLRRTMCWTVVASLALPALADPATGWKQTGAGPYDYNDAANWVGGDINGVFGADLTLTANQTITFAANTALPDGLNIAYKGNYALTFQSDGNGSKTLTLGGDITCNVAANGNAAHVTFGSDTAANNLAINLGGAQRTFASAGTQNDPSKSGWVKLYAPMSNGAVTYSGIGCFKLYAANTYTGGTTLSNTGYIYMNDAGCFSSGAVTIADCGGSAWPRLHCDAANITIANNFTILGDFGFHGSKQTSLTGTLTIPDPIRFWCESDNLTINSPAIEDGDGGCGIGNLQKWGSKTFNVYTPISVNGTTITVANGVWNQRGAISGTSFTLVGDTGGNAFFHCYSAANNFTGPVTVNGDPNFLYLSFQTAGALPDGVTILLMGRGLIQGVPSAGYACGTLLANERIDPASTGGIAIVNGANDNTDIDLTDYPSLFIASSGNPTYNGHITAVNGLYHFRSPSNLYLGAANALTGQADVLIDGVGTLYLQNGNDIEGTITVASGGLCMQNANGAAPNADIVVKNNSSLFLYDGKGSGAIRAKSITLQAANLGIQGNTSYDVAQSIAGSLIIDGSRGGCSFVTLNANNKKALSFTAARLEMPVPAVLAMQGIGLGNTPGANACNFFVGEAPELVGGGGAAGTTTISIAPRIVGAATADGTNPSKYVQSFVTYESGIGFRPLDLNTEYASTIPGSGTPANLRIPSGTTLELSDTATVNSLLFQGSGSTPVVALKQSEGATDAKLVVASGQIICGQRAGVGSDYATAPIDFGTATGVVWHAHNAIQNLSGAIAGSGGLILAQAMTGSHPNRYVTFTGSSTLAGDIWTLGDSNFSNGSFLPSGERRGNLHVTERGRVFHSSTSINALNGSGSLGRRSTSGATLTFGCDGVDGDFAGTLGSGENYGLVKIGSGRQRLSGVNSHKNATTVNAGVLQVDGAFTASAVTVASGATLGGVGSFGKAVTVADGAALEAGSAQIDYADDHSLDFEDTLAFSGDATLRVKVYAKDALATVAAASVSGSGTVTVAMDSGDYSGTFLVLKSDAALPCTFAKGANCGSLKLLNNGTELWVSHVPETVIMVR